MEDDRAGVAPTLALCGATVVVALDPPEVVAGDVVLAGDRVAAVGVAPPGVPRRDCSGTVVLPGNVCAHHHLYSALSRGMPYRLAPPTTFTEMVYWLPLRSSMRIGARTCIISTSRPKYSLASRPLTMMRPSPLGCRRTRATAVLRRPVP